MHSGSDEEKKFLIKPHDKLKREPDDANRLNHKERIGQVWDFILLDFSCLKSRAKDLWCKLIENRNER